MHALLTHPLLIFNNLKRLTMPTLKVCLLLLCAIIFFSCNNKKVKTSSGNNLTALAPAIVQQQQETAFDITDYGNGFIKNVTQVFTAARKKITVITARKGLRVTVDPDMLVKQDGSKVDGKVTVSIIELTTSEELFKSNAATVSNGRLLISGGSYFIGMECNGQQLKVKEGKKIKVEFPKLRGNEMELFYGNRDNAGNMNWVTAEQPLAFSTSGNFYAYQPPYPDSLIWKPYKSKYHLYESVNSKVIFDGRTMPLREMISILQKRGVDKNIDTVILSWRQLNDRSMYTCLSSTYKWKRYRIISCKELEAEKDSLKEENKLRDEYIAANEKYDEEWNRVKEENSFTNQLQKYYEPSSVSKLGWINCDRFYNEPQNEEIPLDLPITFNKPEINYFIIYRSFNGLISGKVGTANNPFYKITNLPSNQPITLIAFTKSNGQIYHCKQDVVTGTKKPVQLKFEPIAAAEMNKIFGKNVRI
jgi:hypothetical protein